VAVTTLDPREFITMSRTNGAASPGAEPAEDRPRDETLDTLEELEARSGLHAGTVFRKSRGLYDVRAGSETVRCTISNRLRKRLMYPISDPAGGTRRGVQEVRDIHLVDPIAIGDEVEFVPAEPGHGQIREVRARRNKLARRVLDPKRRGDQKDREQVIVANVDQIVPVFAAAQPKPKWHLLDRYLVSADVEGYPSLICITKLDLADRERLADDVAVYTRVGYRVMLTSAVTGEGVDAFREAITGKTSVFVGKSGVCKTSLLNAIQPDLGLFVKEVSAATGKGRHATSQLEMFPLDGGGGVIDTPGMKVFTVIDDGVDPALHFPEMRPYVGACRFGADCSHTHEPGCAIKEAVEAGKIDERRYRSFLKL
jgi:ribosome biogenesis GTPase